MWHALVFKIVMIGLKALSKSSENTIDDKVIQVVEDCVTLKSLKDLF